MRVNMFVMASIATTLFGQICMAEEKASTPLNISWQVTPVLNPLAPEQINLLNLYMRYPFAKELSKLPRNTRDSFPLYIAVHSNQLDPGALFQYRMTSLIQSGLRFDQISSLMTSMMDLRQGKSLSDEQNDFLYEFVMKDLKKNPDLTLDPMLNPLFSYVVHNPDEFNPRTVAVLKDAVFRSIGLNYQDLQLLQGIGRKKQKNPSLKMNEVSALNKLMLMASLQGIEMYDTNHLLYLQDVIAQNAGRFNPDLVNAFHWVVQNSPSVQKFKHESQVNTPIQAHPNMALESNAQPIIYHSVPQFQSAPQRSLTPHVFQPQ